MPCRVESSGIPSSPGSDPQGYQERQYSSHYKWAGKLKKHHHGLLSIGSFLYIRKFMYSDKQATLHSHVDLSMTQPSQQAFLYEQRAFSTIKEPFLHSGCAKIGARAKKSEGVGSVPSASHRGTWNKTRAVEYCYYELSLLSTVVHGNLFSGE